MQVKLLVILSCCVMRNSTKSPTLSCHNRRPLPGNFPNLLGCYTVAGTALSKLDSKGTQKTVQELYAFHKRSDWRLTAAPACCEGDGLALGVAIVVAFASWGYNTKVWLGVKAYTPTGPLFAGAGW